MLRMRWRPRPRRGGRRKGLAVSLPHRSSRWPLDNGGRSPRRSLARCLADGTGHRESGRCAAQVSARWTLWLLVVGTLLHSHTRTVDPNSDSESHADSGVCGVAVCRYRIVSHGVVMWSAALPSKQQCCGLRWLVKCGYRALEVSDRAVLVVSCRVRAISGVTSQPDQPPLV